MKLIKSDGSADLTTRAKLLAEHAKVKSAAEKSYEITKSLLSQWLLENRQIDVERLPIGETVLIQENGKDILRISVGAQNRVILEELAKFPEVEKEVRRDMPTRTFKSLV